MARAFPISVADPVERRESSYLASLAKQALVAEAELTPKPGLVDRRGSGAHSDLSLGLMKRSADAIEPYFSWMADVSAELPQGRELRRELGAIGRSAERSMFDATGGANTHKGAIWILGLLVSAASHTGERQPLRVASAAGSIARLSDPARPELLSHGDMVRAYYKVAGARGEAYLDFPHVIQIGLPALEASRRNGRSETASRLSALLSIMAQLDDTCVLYRGGLEGAAVVKNGARAVLGAGGPGMQSGDTELEQFDQELIRRRLSPGGSADLLAAALFLDSLRSVEEIYGAN
jgi:triphosphoribosyl-dephospho-CoA synthase